MGGAHTTNLVITSAKFYADKPELVSIILKSLSETDQWINDNKGAAVSGGKEPDIPVQDAPVSGTRDAGCQLSDG